MTADIQAIELRKFDHNYWVSEHAVITTTRGRYKYRLEYEQGTWSDHADYIDNAQSDFENEASIGGGIDDSELFDRMDGDVK